MTQLTYMNGRHLNYLAPLLKWRVLDIEALRKEAIRAPQYKNFHRIIRVLEKKNILGGLRDPYSRKKYIYLTSVGEKLLSLKDNPTALSTETLIHDIKVSEVSRGFLEKGWAKEIELEHQIVDKKNFMAEYKIVPDAVIHTEKDGFKYRIALELELTRKSNQRVIEKAKLYNATSIYHYVIYLFGHKSLLEKYKEIISDAVGSDGLKRFIFLFHEELTHEANKLDSITGYFKDKNIRIQDIFT